MKYSVQDQIVSEDRNQLVVSLVVEITREKLHDCWTHYRYMMHRILNLKMLHYSPVLLCTLAVLLLCTGHTSANPIDDWPAGHVSSSKLAKPQIVNECGLKGEMQVQTLCQRCAKSTKSDMVYPMCCENREEARQWCQRYMEFGIHEM